MKSTKSEEWTAAQVAVFRAGDTGASLTQVDTLLDAHRAFVEQSAHNAAAVGTMREWLAGAGGGIERHRDHGGAVARVAALEGAAEAMAAAGATYAEALAAAREKFEQLGTLERVVSWATAWSDKFASGDVGAGSAEAVLTLIDAHTEYEEQRPRYAAMLGAAGSSQGEVVSRRAEVEARVAELDAAARAFAAALEATRVMHEQVAAMEKVAAYVDHHAAAFADAGVGGTLAETEALLSEHAAYEAAFTRHAAALAGVPASHEVALRRHAEVSAAVEALRAAGEAHGAALAERKAGFEAAAAAREAEITAALDAQVGAYDDAVRECHAAVAAASSRLRGAPEGRNSGAVGAQLVALAEYRAGEKPDVKALVNRVHFLLGALQSAQRGHRRPVYLPPAALSLHAVDEDWRGAEALEAAHEAALRAEYNALLELEGVLARFRSRAVGAEEWMAAQQAVFDEGHMGADLAETSALLERHGAFAGGNAANGEALGVLRGALATEGIARHEDTAAAVARMATIEAAAAALEEAAAAYAAALGAARDKFVHLGLLGGVDAWIAARGAVFASGDHGATPEAVPQRIVAHTEYVDARPKHAGALAQCGSPAPEVVGGLAATRQALGALDAAAEEYLAACEAARVMHEQVAAMAKVASYVGHQQRVFAVEDFGSTLTQTETLLAAHEAYVCAAAHARARAPRWLRAPHRV